MDRIEEIQKLLEGADGFQVGISVLKSGTITNHLLTESFPIGDMLSSNNALKQLIIAELEK